MSYMTEYIKKNLSTTEIENELLKLIKNYNAKRNTYLVIYAVAFEKGDLPISLTRDDYYAIYDLLRKNDSAMLDFYIETPGGDGLAAEDIGRFLRGKYEKVNFVVAGEAKSAGTMLVMSGDDILMTETGSLGPIDAQIQIGRSWGSAHDYMQWVDEKRVEAAENNYINPFDALMIAQISPIEIEDVHNNLEFAKEVVVEFLKNYKFKNWNYTETNGHEVTPQMKEDTAREIAEKLANHTHWRSHGRSLKIKDLEDIGLRITNVDEDPETSEIVNKIHVLIRLFFSSTSTYKIFFTADNKLVRQAVKASEAQILPSDAEPSDAEFSVTCPDCGEERKFYVKFIDDPEIDELRQKNGYEPFPKESSIQCPCGFNLDLRAIKNEIETKIGKSIILDD